MKHPLAADRHLVSCPLAFKNLSTQVPWGSSRMSFGFNLADSLHGWCSCLDENTGRTHNNWAGIWAENDEFSWQYAEFKIYGGDQDRLLKRQLNMLVWSSQEWLLKCGGLQIWKLLVGRCNRKNRLRCSRETQRDCQKWEGLRAENRILGRTNSRMMGGGRCENQ